MINKKEYEYVMKAGQNVTYFAIPLDENCPKTEYFIIRKGIKEDIRVSATQERKEKKNEIK